jgi:hypothetical protein
MARLFAPKATETPKEPAKTPDPPAPAISKDEVKTLVSEAMGGVAAQLSQTVRELGDRVTELASRQPQVVVQQPVQAVVPGRGVSDEEIDQAVLSGQGAAARIRALVDRAVNDAADRLVKEQIAPLREFGVNTIAQLSHEVASGKMPHYTRFKKEIDQRVNALDASVRANPAVLKMIHDAVVGEHVGELTKEATEAAIRQAQEPKDKPGDPGTGAGREPKRDAAELPDAQRVGGDDGMAALSHKGHGGQSQDEFARGLGYKDWNDYMKQYDSLLKEAGAA